MSGREVRASASAPPDTTHAAEPPIRSRLDAVASTSSEVFDSSRETNREPGGDCTGTGPAAGATTVATGDRSTEPYPRACRRRTQARRPKRSSASPNPRTKTCRPWASTADGESPKRNAPSAFEVRACTSREIPAELGSSPPTLVPPRASVRTDPSIRRPAARAAMAGIIIPHPAGYCTRTTSSV